MVQEKILEAFDRDDLAVYVVWTPVLRSDNRAAADEGPDFIPDPRAVHYWDGEQMLGKAYGRAVELPKGRELAWDVYFVFPPGVEWGDHVPPPAAWAHQLGRDARHLGDGSGLQEAMRAQWADAKAAHE